MSKIIGVIAEDQSDIDTVAAFLEKYVATNEFSVRKFVGNGCGKLRNKCKVWTEMLLKGGCSHVIIFHDLDRHKEPELREMLSEKFLNTKYQASLIVIPIEEMEAWLLSDMNAIKKVFSLKTLPKGYKNCEDIKSPKQILEHLVWTNGKKRYLNTVHNKRIAENTSLANLQKCSSYIPFDNYLTQTVFPKPEKISPKELISEITINT